MIGNVSDWLSYAGGALIKVADSAVSTVVYIVIFFCFQSLLEKRLVPNGYRARKQVNIYKTVLFSEFETQLGLIMIIQL